MAYKLIEVMNQKKIQCIVAPYEADAQLSFLCRTKYVSCVITEDSDLIPYECPRIFFKMDRVIFINKKVWKWT